MQTRNVLLQPATSVNVSPAAISSAGSAAREIAAPSTSRTSARKPALAPVNHSRVPRSNSPAAAPSIPKARKSASP